MCQATLCGDLRCTLPNAMTTRCRVIRAPGWPPKSLVKPNGNAKPNVQRVEADKVRIVLSCVLASPAPLGKESWHVAYLL